MPPWYGKIVKSPYAFCDQNAEEKVHQCYDVNKPMLLPGTKVYHGTIDPKLELSGEYLVTFFGLDIIISLIYLQELNKSGTNKFGYLYEFQVYKPIPYLYISDMFTNPTEIEECDTNVCIHPQLADPAINCGINTMQSTEMTIPVTQITKYLKYVCRYKVDIEKLDTHDYIDEDINPIDAIIEIETDSMYDPLVKLKKQAQDIDSKRDE